MRDEEIGKKLLAMLNILILLKKTQRYTKKIILMKKEKDFFFNVKNKKICQAWKTGPSIAEYILFAQDKDTRQFPAGSFPT